jgi:hypothetical protein
MSPTLVALLDAAAANCDVRDDVTGAQRLGMGIVVYSRLSDA